ncbi:MULTISPECIES: hypothetical protein [unclassified Hyphomicrobium]|uniref:hypothetical protein n=1 Tax=unclassified Hyphomicrobium TaxID=2619925 RepID=UPI000213F43F|nr:MULTISPECIES: hypothetical protein [unclassified Hyphomicrobium]CCB64926.1 protein of unknown function [Hyphomicrobium sp. MC1]
MQAMLSGKRVLIVKGSLLAPCALEKTLRDRSAKVITATNVISAFSIIEQEDIDVAVIDKGLHNEAFDLCAELNMMEVPYLLADAPHELQRPVVQRGAAARVVADLENMLRTKTSAQARVESSFPAGRFPAARSTSAMVVLDPEWS